MEFIKKKVVFGKYKPCLPDSLDGTIVEIISESYPDILIIKTSNESIYVAKSEWLKEIKDYSYYKKKRHESKIVFEESDSLE